MWTLGHSTRTLEELVALARAHGVTTVADVRKIPRSRRHPHFSAGALARALPEAGLAYVPMQTDEFAAHLDALVERGDATAIMCAEALWWRCHRSLIADALVARGVAVHRILSAARAEPHVVRPWARLDGVRVFYPGPPEPFDMKGGTPV